MAFKIGAGVLYFCIFVQIEEMRGFWSGNWGRCFVAGATFRKSNKWLQKEGEGNIKTNPAPQFPTTCVSCPTL